MSLKPTREQSPLYNRFMRLVNDAEFIKDIEKLRASDVDILKSTYENVEVIVMPDGDDIVNGDEVLSLLHQAMIKHDLPLAMESFIYHYVIHNETDLEKLNNGVYLVDKKAMEASGPSDDMGLNYHGYTEDIMYGKYIEVTLAIPAHATITQINDTIKQHKQFIRDRQLVANNGMPVQRVRLLPKAQRNNEIMRLYRKGYKPREILWELSDNLRGTLTAPDISKIINKQKKTR